MADEEAILRKRIDEEVTLREIITHAIALIITIPLICVATYVLLVGGEHLQELTFISGILGVIMGFYFGQRGVERVEIGRANAEEDRKGAEVAKIKAEEDRKIADEAKRKAYEDRKIAQEAKIKAERIRRFESKNVSLINEDSEKYKRYVRKGEWNKFRNKLPEEKRELPSPWDTEEEDRTEEQKKFLLEFERKWETQVQVQEDQTEEVRDVSFTPPQSKSGTSIIKEG